MKTRTQNLAAVAFVYEHKRTHETAVVYLADAKNYPKKSWHHVATIDPAGWIEHFLNHPTKRNQQIEDLCYMPGRRKP